MRRIRQSKKRNTLTEYLTRFYSYFLSNFQSVVSSFCYMLELDVPAEQETEAESAASFGPVVLRAEA